MLFAITIGDLLIALLRRTTTIPGRNLQVGFLVSLGPDREFMVGACTAAIVRLSGLGVGVIKDEEGGPAHVVGVEVDIRLTTPLLVVVNLHEEFAIVVDHGASRLSQRRRPLVGAVRVVTTEVFCSPGVSDLDEFDIIAACVFEQLCSEDGVGMAHSEANFVLMEMVASFSSHKEDVASCFSSRDLFPDLLCCVPFFFVHDILLGCTVEGSEGHGWVATDCVLVVAMVLGEGLLENSTPEGAILSDLGRVSFPPSIAVRPYGQIIVDNDRVGLAEDVEIHAVDAVGARLILSVEEDLLQAVLLFSEG